jgi:Ca2+-transporting ATPase
VAGVAALALGLEAGEPGIMTRPPRPATEPIINREMTLGIVVQTIAEAGVTLGAFVLGLRLYPASLIAAQTIAFVTLVSAELFRAYTARSERYPLLRLGLFTNRYMVWATLSSFVLLLGVIYIPALDPIFSTYELPLRDWLFILPLTLVPSVSAELLKWWYSAWARRPHRAAA